MSSRTSHPQPASNRKLRFVGIIKFQTLIVQSLTTSLRLVGSYCAAKVFTILQPLVLSGRFKSCRFMWNSDTLFRLIPHLGKVGGKCHRLRIPPPISSFSFLFLFFFLFNYPYRGGLIHDFYCSRCSSNKSVQPK